MTMADTHATSGVGKDVATLGGGCFWCLEAVYDQMMGVTSVESGYMGGDVSNPSYEAVCSGRTGHAEVVQVTFDSAIVSYREILEVFFAIHDPTTLNRQGNDVGTQYRSAIFYHSPQQKAVAGDVIAAFTKDNIFEKPIVTQVVRATNFYVAEDYHQEYSTRNPLQPYCVYVVNPKVAKFRKQFAEKLKA
jgi:peptide-methionine (S)-S-oxide reductase